ncbi:MAG TPA: hypothetical protein PKD55_14285 [Bellilinea sp.]|nr:hypothetical protein [Bellilinea sp.]
MSPDKSKKLQGFLILLATAAGLIDAVVRPGWDARILPGVELGCGLALVLLAVFGRIASWSALPGLIFAGVGLLKVLAVSGVEPGWTAGSWLLPLALIAGLVITYWFGFDQRWALTAAGALLAFVLMQVVHIPKLPEVIVFLGVFAIWLTGMIFVLSPRRYWLAIPALTCLALAVLYSMGEFRLIPYFFFGGLVLSGLGVIIEAFAPQRPGGMVHGRQ